VLLPADQAKVFRRIQRKDIVQNTEPARRPAWLGGGKQPSRASFVGDGSFRGCLVRARFPRNETLDSLCTLHHKYSNYRHKLKYAQTAGASGVWVFTYRILRSVHTISHITGSMYSTSQ
jgi:hypothetical protein